MIIPFIIFIFSILSCVAIIIPSLPAVIDRRKKGFKKLKKHGLLFFVAITILAFMPLIQYYFQSLAEKTKEKAHGIEQDKRDAKIKYSYDSSLKEMKKSFDTSNEKTTFIISDNLGKYGYRFDSVTQKLIKVIRDSTRSGDDPVLQVRDGEDNAGQRHQGIEISGNENEFIRFGQYLFSGDAGSSDLEVKFSIVGRKFDNQLFYLGKDNFADSKFQISKNGYATSYFYVRENIFESIYVWCRGKYKNIDKSKSFAMEQFYIFKIKERTWSNIKGSDREDIISFILKNEK